MANYGLSALMEGIRHSEHAITENGKLYALFEGSVPDHVASAVTGDNYDLMDGEDSVENDLAGKGIGYDEETKLKKLIDTIPEDNSEDDEIDEDEIKEITESVLGSIGG